MALDEAQIREALSQVEDPDLHRDIVSLGFVKDVKIEGGQVAFNLELTTPACPVKDKMKAECEAALLALPEVNAVEVTLSAQVKSSGISKSQALSGVKHVVAVASGKGGVGKSTVASNLALALADTGAAVGLLDADIYGPSAPLMFNTQERPTVISENELLPVKAHGISLMSMGLVSDDNTPVIWRGPMVHGVLRQFLESINWGNLDYLVIDLPPGTGDAQLTLCQLAPLSGAVIVSTPQDVALIDARKGLKMFSQLKVPVLGIVENMSAFVCDACGKEHPLFGQGGATRMAQELDVPHLGSVPIDPEVVLAGDQGTPIVKRNPEAPASQAFAQVAGQVAARLSVLSHQEAPPEVNISWQAS